MRVFGGLQVCLCLASFVSCRGQDRAREENAVRQFVDQFARAENTRNVEQLSQLFTVDGEAVVQNSVVAHGRDEIKKAVTPRLPWSEVGPATYKVERIRLLDAKSAVVDAKRSTVSPALVRSSAATFILSKEKAGWRVASYRCSSPAPLADSPFVK